MIKYTILFLFQVSIFGAFSQSFEENIKEASKEYKEKNYQRSGELYDQAFEVGEGQAYHFYHAACSWSLAQNSEKAIDYLRTSSELGWRYVDQTRNDSDLEQLKDHSEWNSILMKIQANLDEYEKDYDKGLQGRLDSIYVRDQTLRQLYMEAERKFGKESAEMNYFWRLMSKEDRKNEMEILEIIEEYGWPGISQVGGKANMTVWLVIQHAPLELQEKYLPVMKESVDNGESSGRHYSTLQDRILIGNNKPQIYGTQFKFDSSLGRNVFYKIVDPEFVNQRRSEVGLGPIEAYATKFGMEWDIQQKEK